MRACAASQDPGRSCRPLLQNERPRPGPGQGPGQDRTGSHLQEEAVSPYRLLGAKHGPPTPGPPRIALELPQRQSAVPQQPDNHAAQTSPGSPATIAFPFHHPTLNISPPKPTRPVLTRPSGGNPSRHALVWVATQPRQRPSSSSSVARQSLTHTLTRCASLHPRPVSSLASSLRWQLQPSWLIHVCPSCCMPTQPTQPTCQPARHLTHASGHVPPYLRTSWTLE